MPTQTRATLKGYFTKGSIPTENNFADLIDSTLIQIDDGLLTSATAPLSIKAVGADEGLINFYRVESGQNPNTTTWQIKHLPVGSSTPGLSIGTPAATRLFIDNTTGNVGIGTVTPGFPLTIGNNTLGDKISLWGQSGNHYGFGIQGYQLQIHTGAASDDVVFGYGNSGSMTETMRIKGNGSVGIGTGTPAEKLDVSGNIKFNNILSTPGRMHITGEELLFLLHKQGVIIGREWGGNGNLTVEGDIMLNGTLSGTGNVGIGTPSPGARLEVNGGAVISNGNGYAAKSNFMASGSLTIGGLNVNYGGGRNWNTNTAALLFETSANTEIAVHDSGTRVASLMYYEGDAANQLTIGRDMGWGGLNKVIVSAPLQVTGSIISPMWKVTQVFERRSGPLPISESFLSSGGTLIVFFSGTAYKATTGIFSITVTVDTVANYVDLYTNEINSHKTFPSTFFVIRGIAAGRHTLTIAAFANGTISDFNDRYQATVLELPF